MQVLPETAPTPADVYAARDRIARFVRRTPLEPSETLRADHGADIRLKLESWQRTRSFKVRGAFNAVLSLTAAQHACGIVTASAGNHGQAVALAGREAGARVTVFVPATAPALKQQRIRHLGAELRTDAATYDDAEQAAREHAAHTGAVFVHAFSDPAVIAGQGTIALELLEELPGVREVVVPVGGGGLIGGIGLVLKSIAPAVRVIGVQSTETRAMYEAFQHGRVVDVPVPPTLADGLAGCTDEAAFELARRVVDDLVLVEEAEIADSMRMLQLQEGVTAEGAGAVAVAAVRSGRITLTGPAALLVTGANVDAATFISILSA